MSATTSSEDKYAFLFRTDTGINLSDVKNTLSNLYGYPAANIKESVGCANLASDFQAVANAIAGHTPAGTPHQGQARKNTFIVFICGNANSGGLSDGSNIIDWDSLGYNLDPGPAYYSNSEVHFFLIFPYCDNMVSRLTFFPDGSINLPVCPDFSIFNGQSGYLAAWKQAFDTDVASLFNSDKLLTFHAAANKIYSLGNPGTSTLATFFKQKAAGSDDTGFISEYYPGYPSLEIEDGNPYFYKTNDIWLNDLDPLDTTIPQADRDLYDNYEADKDNKISVRIHNKGTHPVKDFNVGVGVFRTGGGGDCDVNPAGDRPVSLPQLLKPGEDYIYSYTEFFEPQYSHRCIKARASLDVISDSVIDEYTDWDIGGRNSEAQLNIDPGGVAKSLTGQGGGDTGEIEPGQGQVDEENPGEDAEPDTGGSGTGSKSLRNIRSCFEHVYHIKNRFKTRKEFRIVLPPVIGEYRELIKCRWFLTDKKYPAKLTELKITGDGKKYVSVTLRPGESSDLVLYMHVKDAGKLGITNIPFDILVEKMPRWIPLKTLFRYIIRPSFRPFSGVNVVLSNSSGDIKVRVSDSKNNPVPGAYVFIKTLDGRQSAAIKTLKDGCCECPGINTGSYRVWAKYKGSVTKQVTVNLHNKKTEKVDLKLGD